MIDKQNAARQRRRRARQKADEEALDAWLDSQMSELPPLTDAQVEATVRIFSTVRVVADEAA
ncbi:hypothetical protein AB0O34_32200 [Sphaerisporangium sp. NPDC088356]|uniref:hypothetical protein n=1 Tax=Sphaerisporangium sp. NPDC088356 TaxID=3154871 RepID=UPI00341F1363